MSAKYTWHVHRTRRSFCNWRIFLYLAVKVLEQWKIKYVHMYYLVGFLLVCALIKAYRDYRRMPNCTLVVYILILVMDLLVGCSIIVWKCSISKSEEECEVATGGTVGSIIIWLLIMLVCPCFATRIEICLTLDNFKKKLIKYMDKIRPRKSRDIVIHNEANTPTTTALLQKGEVSPVYHCSKLFVFNEKNGVGDLYTIPYGKDRDRDRIPLFTGAITHIKDIT